MRKTGYKDFTPDENGYLGGDVDFEATVEPNVVTSLSDNYPGPCPFDGNEPFDWSSPHYPVIDLDFDCELVPSSTPGHYHLYLNTPVAEQKYFAMLKAMVDAGVVEEGFYSASVERGYTTCRLPGVKKK